MLEAQWETLKQCEKNYCHPVKRYISCKEFGSIDGMDGSCWWCKEMTPYQWHMCSDESHKRNLMKNQPFGKGYTEQEAIDFIQKYKQRINSN